MTGFGSPCGACKFLRRKCVRGCVFAPYFCHEQGATHFAAIHKVFGASNVSKLLMHLPLPDRCEAAVTISYEAQARLQDPVYGCVSHIFALQQQVVNLQAQLASLKAQAAQSYATGTQDDFCNSLLPYQQHGQSCLPSGDDVKMMRTLLSNQHLENNSNLPFYGSAMVDSDRVESSMEYDHSSAADVHLHFGGDDGSACVDMQTNGRKSGYQDMDDLQSAALAYLRHS
ncbi:unnamed protein product [Spirodela intermedia]|uniref:LOB domain-containing protein n=1 Tax=Spirodela intermedia TaxID=51605 RepID=A0A7I8L048_SPIIN|nr:unnamed protein product [Spirodela intermedia]